MTASVPQGLRERFLRRFLDAWPKRDIAEGTIRSDLKLTIETEDGERLLVADLLGHTTAFGFDAGDDLDTLVDDLAAHVADNFEGDRWTDGDGWREYRPDAG